MRKEFRDLALGPEQLAELALALRSNAMQLTSDARLLLDAGRVSRAHALAVLALEEVGKLCFCMYGLMGLKTSTQVLDDWGNHKEKLTFGHVFAALFAESSGISRDVVDELEAVVESDAALRLRGIYVDPTTDGVAQPTDIDPAQASTVVVLAEEVGELLAQMELDDAVERFSSDDAVQVREFCLKLQADLAAAATEVESLPAAEQAERIGLTKAGVDELYSTLRHSLAEGSGQLAE